MAYPSGLPLDSGDARANQHAQWLRDMLDALEQAQWFISVLSGAAEQDGVLSYGSTATDSFKVTAQSPASMSVDVNAGAAIAQQVPFRKETASVIGPLTAPSSNPRIDLIVVDLTDQQLEVKQGTEAASPSAPTPDSDQVKLAEIALATSTAEITGSEVTLVRDWLNL